MCDGVGALLGIGQLGHVGGAPSLPELLQSGDCFLLPLFFISMAIIHSVCLCCEAATALAEAYRFSTDHSIAASDFRSPCIVLFINRAGAVGPLAVALSVFPDLFLSANVAVHRTIRERCIAFFAVHGSLLSWEMGYVQ